MNRGVIFSNSGVVSLDEIISETIGDTHLLPKAYALMVKAHEGQMRREMDPETGNPYPYIQHTTSVGLKLAQLGYEQNTVISGLLHDVRERHPSTRFNLHKLFNDEVRGEVITCTEQNSKRSGKFDKKEQMILNFIRRSFAFPNSIAIKSIDRIHNWTSSDVYASGVKRRIATETDLYYRPLTEAFDMRIGHYFDMLEDTFEGFLIDYEYDTSIEATLDLLDYDSMNNLQKKIGEEADIELLLQATSAVTKLKRDVWVEFFQEAALMYKSGELTDVSGVDFSAGASSLLNIPITDRPDLVNSLFFEFKRVYERIQKKEAIRQFFSGFIRDGNMSTANGDFSYSKIFYDGKVGDHSFLRPTYAMEMEFDGQIGVRAIYADMKNVVDFVGAYR